MLRGDNLGLADLLQVDDVLGSLDPDDPIDEEEAHAITNIITSLSAIARAGAYSSDAAPVLASVLDRGARWLDAHPELAPGRPLWSPESVDALALDIAEGDLDQMINDAFIPRYDSLISDIKEGR